MLQNFKRGTNEKAVQDKLTDRRTKAPSAQKQRQAKKLELQAEAAANAETRKVSRMHG
jgi:hypothetical protein